MLISQFNRMQVSDLKCRVGCRVRGANSPSLMLLVTALSEPLGHRALLALGTLGVRVTSISTLPIWVPAEGAQMHQLRQEAL